MTQDIPLYDLVPVAANSTPLTPLSFLRRCAEVRPDHPAVIYGARVLSWADVYRRSLQLANALAGRGIGKGETVAVLLPNVPAMYETFFGVPMCGAVLTPLNTRLDAASVAYALEHSRASLLMFDPEYAEVVGKALSMMDKPTPYVVVSDPLHPFPHDMGDCEYEDMLTESSSDAAPYALANEQEPISINYTSGTSGNPKGVLYTHRGAFLNSIGNTLTFDMGKRPVYLWTLPMFHASGWCFPWSVAALAGTNVCLRKIDPELIFDLIEKHRVTHFCAAPIVHAMLMDANRRNPRQLDHAVGAMIAGAAPPASVIEGMARIGITLTHVYGLTETYGPCTYCEIKEEWADLPPHEHAAMVARQGVRSPLQEGLEVMNPETMTPVPNDGESIGEVMFRGNLVMAGYFGNPEATDEAFKGGWFHTGDLAVRHPDGWIEVRDRAKDIIISGGENIASIEIEDALYKHPSVLFAAIVALADDHWGEVPCAFIELKPGAEADEASLMAHCRERLAGFKRPKKFVFGELPKTSTGKIQKFVLRSQAADLVAQEWSAGAEETSAQEV